MSDQDQGMTQKPTQEEVSKKVINAMARSFSSDVTMNWLKNMSEDISPADSLCSEGEPPYMTMLSCVDTIFDHFQRYSFEFNKDQSNESLRTDCERPDYTRVQDGSVKFQGHISTGSRALIIEAEPERILCYMLKTDLVSEFSARRAHFQPFFEVYATSSPFGLVWKAEDKVIYYEHLSFIAKKLFARLVRVSRKEASELEPFKILAPEPAEVPRLGQALNRIRYAATTQNADQVLRESMTRTDNVLTEIVCMLEVDLQEFTKIGIMALRSGNHELRERLAERTRLLTEMTRDLKIMADKLRSTQTCNR